MKKTFEDGRIRSRLDPTPRRESVAEPFAWLARARRVAGPVHAVAPEPLRSPDLKELLEEAAPRHLRVTLPRLALRRRVGFLADVSRQ